MLITLEDKIYQKNFEYEETLKEILRNLEDPLYIKQICNLVLSNYENQETKIKNSSNEVFISSQDQTRL